MSGTAHDSKLQTLLSFLEDDPNDVFTHYAIALEYERLKDVPKALEKLHEALKLDSSYVAAYQQLGRIYSMTGDPKKAAAILIDGIAVAQKIGDTHARLEMQEELDEIEAGE